MRHCGYATRNQPCSEVAAAEASYRIGTVRDQVAMCGQVVCRVCEAVCEWRNEVGWRFEVRETAADFHVTYSLSVNGPHTSSFSPTRAYYSHSGLRTSFTPFQVCFLLIRSRGRANRARPPSRGRERMGFLEEAMDTAIDLSNASKALDLANIRFQLM